MRSSPFRTLYSICSWLLIFHENVLMSVTSYFRTLYNIPEETLMLCICSWHIHVTVNFSCIFRPPNRFEQKNAQINILPNNEQLQIKELVYEQTEFMRHRLDFTHESEVIEFKLTTFTFDHIFGPNTKQVSMSFVFFWYLCDTLVVKCNLY